MTDTLRWREGRATPSVVRNGKVKGGDSGGKVIASRKATAEEQKRMDKGQYVRARPPGQPNKKSSVRPALAAKQKNKNPK